MIVTAWSTLPDGTARNRCSPNLVELNLWLANVHSFRPLGCYGERNVRGGEMPSAHSHGAATDTGYGLERRDVRHPAVPDRQHALAVIELVIDRCDVLGVQAVHDYIGGRIWHADRVGSTSYPDGWKPAATVAGRFVDPNMGGAWATWFHIETSFEAWSWDTPIADRLAQSMPPASHIDPPQEDDMSKVTELVSCKGAVYAVKDGGAGGKEWVPLGSPFINDVAFRWQVVIPADQYDPTKPQEQQVRPREIKTQQEMVSLGAVTNPQVPSPNPEHAGRTLLELGFDMHGWKA